VFSGNFTFILTISLLIVSYFESLLSIFFKNIWKQLKSLTIETTKNKLIEVALNIKLVNIISCLFIYFIITLKTTKLMIFTPVIILLMITKKLLHSNQNHSLIMLSIVLFTIMYIYVSNFIILFMFLEFYSIIFYFYLLQHDKNNILSLVKYKNSLLLYLFNNFVITILFIFSLSHILYMCGTLHFVELSLVSQNKNTYLIALILSIIVKLSLPGFHFLKIEMYKYLPLKNVIMFSVITLFVNFLLINFMLSINFITNIMLTYKILNLILILGIFILIQKLKINTFQEFIAYSGFATNNLILLNFLV